MLVAIILVVLLAILGLLGLVLGSFKITPSRVGREGVGRVLGLLMIAVVFAILFQFKIDIGTYIASSGHSYPMALPAVTMGWLMLGIAVVVGLATSRASGDFVRPKRPTLVRVGLAIFALLTVVFLGLSIYLIPSIFNGQQARSNETAMTDIVKAIGPTASADAIQRTAENFVSQDILTLYIFIVLVTIFPLVACATLAYFNLGALLTLRLPEEPPAKPRSARRKKSRE